jgi:hypothetical protein
MVSACSVAADPSSSAESRDTTTPTYDADYQVFASQTDAVSFIVQNAQQYLGDGKPTPLASDDPKTVRVQAAIARHWPTIQRVYAPNIPMPVPVIIDIPVMNAFVSSNFQTGQLLDVVFVYGNILTLSDDDIGNVVAHEMGHLITKNGMFQYQKVVEKDYLAGQPEQLGINAKDDANVHLILDPYDQASEFGGVGVPELAGFPGDGIGSYFLQQYQQAHTDATNPDCATLEQQEKVISDTLSAATDTLTTLVTLSADQRTTLSAAATSAKALALSCLKPAANVDLASAMNTAFGGDWASHMLASETALYQGKDALTGLFAIAAEKQTTMRSIEGAPSYSELRQYSVEEQADDFAMTILHAEGLDASTQARTMLDIAPADYQTKCSALMATGVVPPYILLNPHHGQCYRVFHAHRFSDYLTNGGQGVKLPVLPATNAFAPRRAYDPSRGDRLIVD